MTLDDVKRLTVYEYYIFMEDIMRENKMQE